MEKATSAKELKLMITGCKTSLKYLVGNLILGKNAFDADYAKFDSEMKEGEVFERRVTVVKAPGWLPGYLLCDTPELVRMEMILSATLCPPGLHAFILVINAEQPFRDSHRKATQGHMQHCFGDEVWDHTIVVFTHTDHLGYKTAEDYINSEGARLRSLLEACGNRYLVLSENDAGNNVKVKELFDKIDNLVAKNGCYKTQSKTIQSVTARRVEVDKKSEELRLSSQHQRQKLRNLLLEPKPSLRILMVGWVFSGKSATGNSILRDEVFHSGARTVKVQKHSGTVAGREIIIADTPGWWKFFPAIYTSAALRSEILEGVSLCSPSPNAILLAVPLDTSFTDEQRRVTADNMRLLGERMWTHTMVLFTFGDTLGNKTIEQHIESEGKPLRWLIEKCGKRYHVLDNRSRADDQVGELLAKMEEMVAGNSSFYEAHDRQPETDRNDEVREKEENIAKITEQLDIEWNRRNWERYHILREDRSRFSPPNFSEGRQSGRSEAPAEQEAEMEHGNGQGNASLVESDDDAASGSLKIKKGLLEREWSRREASMLYHELLGQSSEPDVGQVEETRTKVLSWLTTHHTASGYKAEKKKRKKCGKGKHVDQSRRWKKSFESY